MEPKLIQHTLLPYPDLQLAAQPSSSSFERLQLQQEQGSKVHSTYLHNLSAVSASSTIKVMFHQMVTATSKQENDIHSAYSPTLFTLPGGSATKIIILQLSTLTTTSRKQDSIIMLIIYLVHSFSWQRNQGQHPSDVHTSDQFKSGTVMIYLSQSSCVFQVSSLNQSLVAKRSPKRQKSFCLPYRNPVNTDSMPVTLLARTNRDYDINLWNLHLNIYKFHRGSSTIRDSGSSVFHRLDLNGARCLHRWRNTRTFNAVIRS